MNISFKLTERETETVLKIIKRGNEMLSAIGNKVDIMETMMDIAAVNNQGCPLDLDGFLAMDDANFGHDFGGIIGHIDRKTGTLKDFFLPRCAKA